MSSLLDMNRAEKEQYVIQLYKENRSTREIAKLTHMSFRDIGAITKKVKLEANRGRGQLEDTYDYDIKSKSKTTQAIKLFSEFESPVEVAIALDLPTDQVRAIYQEYLEYGLGQIYEEAEYDLHDLLRLHRMVKGLGMEKQEIIDVLEFVKHGRLQTLQAKAEYLRNDIDMLENKKTKATSQLFRLKRMIGEAEDSLAQKRGEIAYLNRETRKLQQRLVNYNTANLSPIAHSARYSFTLHSNISLQHGMIIGPDLEFFLMYFYFSTFTLFVPFKYGSVC